MVTLASAQPVVRRRADGRWCKPCPSCGEEQDYLRRAYAAASFALGKQCRRCSNQATKNCHRGFFGPVRASWIKKCKVGAESRGIEWSVDASEIAAIYERQGGRCALSGWEIGWAGVGQQHTASLDRIDSSGGYTVGNVQLLHKDINMMKQSFSQGRFVEACVAVAAKVKW